MLSRHAPAPFVSVAMPTFNGARYIEEALNSLAGQDPTRPIEILAVDDGSTDATPDLLRRAASRLPLRLLDGPRVGNWVLATQCALREARAPWIAILHQDDRWEPARLARLGPLIDRHPEVDVWLHASRLIGPDGRRLGRWRAPLPIDRPLPPADWFPPLLVQNNLAVPAVLFRRSLLERLGWPDESLRYTADWDYWLRLASHCTAWALPDELTSFRVHAESQTMAQIQRHDEYVDQMNRVLQRHQSALASLGAPQRFARMGKLAVAVNAWLAARAAGIPFSPCHLLRCMAHAGPTGWAGFCYYSRLPSRLSARARMLWSAKRNPPRT